MKHKTIIRVLLVTGLLLPATVFAGDYSFSATGALAGGYNHVWGVYAGADLHGAMAVGDHLDVKADFEALTSGTVSLGATARPKLQFGAGSLYLDTGVLFRFVGDGLFDFVTEGSLGWKMKHIEVRAGLYSRTIGNLNTDIHSVEECVCEPFNLMYLGQYNIKGDDSDWDIWGGCANFTSFEYERCWSPIFYLGGRKDLNDSLTLFGQTEIKPTGMFHLNACFYGIICRLGAVYSF